MNKIGQITTFLQQKFKANIIILEGSRAAGTAREDSDWDIYVFVEDKSVLNQGWHLFEDELLDLHFIDLPIKEDYVIKGMFGPRPYLKVILDNDQKIGEHIVKNTAEARSQNPEPLSEESYQIRKIGMVKNIAKIKAEQDNPITCFYHVSNFYDRALRFWFHLNQEWPTAPKEAFPYLKKRDHQFYTLMESLVTEDNWKKKAAIAQRTFDYLFTKELKS